ncbi:MAG: thiamine pyrophosphate-dependent dehydrogenase E1 component subunit alpha [Chlamydiia bacterium]|nr:thiamine pyrophosphate-dependent dehydrogenase E1 component subunit alpha [Chlamydiia bacterium]
MNTQILQFLPPDGELLRTHKPDLTDNQILKAYQVMCQTRHVEERMLTLQRQGAISFSMSGLGEEAAIVGSAAALNMEDWLYPQYRETGAIFWRGLSIQDYVHHMFGNAMDPSLGRQMPNHFGSKALNVVTVSSTVAGQIPHAAGAAYAMKLQKEPTCTLTYFGDGGTSEGDFHAGLNFAAVRKCPTIFFCRNNGWAISTPIKDQYAAEDVFSKGIGYGIHAEKVDGNDFFAVYHATKSARQRAVNEHKPTLIEAVTYRLGAHSTSDDPSAYRSQEDVEAWKEKCPILRLRRYLEKRGLWDTNQDKAFQQALRQETDEAIRVARDTPRPPLEKMITDVFETPTERLKEELSDLCRK